MTSWIEVVAVIVLAVAAWMAGRWIGQKSKFWAYGMYAVGMGMVLLFGLQRFFVNLDFVAPFSWLITGRVKFMVAAVVIPLIFVPLFHHVPKRRMRFAMGVVAVLMVAQCSVLPFLHPALAQKKLAALKTQVDNQGVCLQQTDYTCGPAAAVTLLRQLGFPADEGVIAIWSMTSPVAGTAPDVLADELRKHYGRQGLSVSMKQYRHVSDLPTNGLTLAVIKYSFLTDHFVAILRADDRGVVVADPSSGVTHYSNEEFAKVWRFSGIELGRSVRG